MIGFVWWRWGRERGTSYDREYEQEPPTETQPALVPGLLAQGGTPGSLEFTATLFDLIRRGRYRAEQVTTERKIWGGLKTQQVADLELSLGDVEAPVEAFEAPVAQVVDSILADGPERLSHFRDRIEDDRTGNSERFTSFKSAVGTEVKNRHWFQNVGLAALLGGAVVLGVVGGLTLLWSGSARTTRSRRPGTASSRSRSASAGSSDAAVLVGVRLQPAALAPALARGAGRGRALGGVPPLPDRLPAPRHRAGRVARALGALSRLRDRVRDRGARPAGGAAAHAGGARHGEHALLDRAARRPRLGPDVDEHRRPRVGLRLGARSALVRLGRVRRRLLGRRRRGRRRWRRRRLVRPWLLAAVALLVAGCGGGGDEQAAATTEVTTGSTTAADSCSPGVHELTLGNGQAARMHVTPGDGPRALIVALHGAGGTPAGAIEAFGGAWDEPGLVLIAPASKGQTWSILRSQQDLDLESVNLALAEAYERCTIDRRRIAVGGFSDGATYALTLGVSNGDLFPAVIALLARRDRRGRAAGRPALLRLARHARQRPSDRQRRRRCRPQAPPGRLPVTYRRFRGDHEVLDGHVRRGRPLVPRRRARLAPRALVERDRPGDGDVERLGRARSSRSSRHGRLASTSSCGQPVAAPLRGRTSTGPESSSSCSGGAPCATSATRSPGASSKAEQRDAEDRAGRGAQRLRAERVGAALRERHRGAERVRGAQQRADVAGIGDAPERERRLARLRAAARRVR